MLRFCYGSIRRSGTAAGKKIYEYACNILVDAAKIHAVEASEEKLLHMASCAGDKMAALCAAYCKDKTDTGLKVRYLECTVEDMLPALHHHTIDVGFLCADQRRMATYLQMIERKHLEFTVLCQTGPSLYVGPENPFYQSKEVSEKRESRCFSAHWYFFVEKICSSALFRRLLAQTIIPQI